MKTKMFKIIFTILTCLFLGISISGCTAEDGVDGIDGVDGVDGTDGVDGADGADGIDGTDGADGEVNSGKTHIVLTGNITDSEASQIILDDFGSNTQYVTVQNTTNLTNLDLSMVGDSIELISLVIFENSALTSVTMPTLTEVRQDVRIFDNHALLSVSFGNLNRIYGFTTITGNVVLKSIDFPSLENSGYINIYGNTALDSIDFSVLKTSYAIGISESNLKSVDFPMLIEITNFFSFYKNDSLVSINFPLLDAGGHMEITFNPIITSIAFPQLAALDNLDIAYNDALQTISLPALSRISPQSQYIDLSSNMLSVSSVNGLLSQLAGLTPSLTERIIFIQQAPAAAPTGQGITDKNTLISNGNTVNTD